MASKRVAIIGAGMSGLSAIKACVEEGFDPVCYERGDDVGGLWKYSEEVKYGLGNIMKSTYTNLSKELMSFGDFIAPASAPNYLRHDAYHRLLGSYADAYDLKRYIHFKTEVVSVKKADDFENNGRWAVSTKEPLGSEFKTKQFDYVLVCNGIHGYPSIPKFPGLENFKGKIIHSHAVRHSRGFEGKRILVVGFGNTGGDVAVELSREASQLYLSTRSGVWLFSRVTPSGSPYDFELMNRKLSFLFDYLPTSWVDSIVENYSERNFKNSQYGIKPVNRAHEAEPTANDFLPAAILYGQVILHDDIKEFTQNGVVFVDGSKVEDIDVVVMATGYEVKFPFLEEEVLSVNENKVDLYNYCIPPDLEHHTLAMIGCIQVNGGVPTVVETQARYLVRVFSKKINLPSREDMWESLKLRKKMSNMRFRDTKKNALRSDVQPYCDLLAEEIGCRPNLGKMLLTDPMLAWACFFGPLLPYQYRLEGPGKWAGARDAILTVWERILPINKNGLTFKSSSRSVLVSRLCTLLPLMLLLFVVILLPVVLAIMLKN